MTRRFAKYEGLGNDFIVLDREVSPSEVVRLCDRRHGVGADGVVVELASPDHDARMRIVNADGSTPEMCGNGIRCLALHIAMGRGLDDAELLIDTDAGPRSCRVHRIGDHATVRVDMGDVRFIEDRAVAVEGRDLTLALADAGNPHAVMFGDFDSATVEALGPRIATHPAFRGGTNVEFATVRGEDIRLVVWERGVGRTLACGTGACATAAVAWAKKLVSKPVVRVSLPGGDLEVERVNGKVFMTGPARLVYRGELAGEVEP